ncbi:MAG: archaeal flagellar protein FlaJ [Methanofollis sp.]|nr:archaeal flagellar protein FlaJ [Methanofollis sp.]
MEFGSISAGALFEYYKRFCYLFGEYFERNPSPEIERLCYQADVEMTPAVFTGFWLVSSVLAALGGLIAGFVIFMLPISPFVSEMPVPFVFLFMLIGGGVAAVGFPFYLSNQISNKKIDIERNLPYALAFMSILASSGTTPLDIIRRIVYEDYGFISTEFSKVLFRVDILGEDAVTAMNGLANNTPSEAFRDICIDITNIIYSGGGLDGYLGTKSKELLEMRRQTDKEFVESLGIFGEGYLGGVVMTLVLAVLGVVITGALGVEIGPFEPKDLWFGLIYLLTPLVNVIFLLLLTVKYSAT